MTATAFLNLSAGELLLQPKPCFYRLTFARTRAGGLIDSQWYNEMVRVFNEFPGRVKLAFPVTPFAVDRTASTTVVDVKPSAGAGSHSVGELAAAVAVVCDRVGLDSVELRSVARIPPVDELTPEATADVAKSEADAAKKLKDEQSETPWGKLLEHLKSLGTVTYWLVIALLVGGAAFIAWKGYHAVKTEL